MTNRNRRPFEWYSTSIGPTVIASAGQFNLALVSIATVPISRIKDSTVTRILLSLIWHPESVTTATDLFYGITIITAEAAIAGGIPEADDMSDRADWLIRGKMTARSGNLSDGSQDAKMEADLRAQRIMRSEESELHIVFDANTSGISGEVRGLARVLLKLP